MDAFCYLTAALFFLFGLALVWDDLKGWFV